MRSRKGDVSGPTIGVIITVVIAVLFITVIGTTTSGKMSDMVFNILPGGKCPDTGKSASSYVDDLERNLNAGNKELSLSIYHEFNSCFDDSKSKRVNKSKIEINEMFYDYYKPQVVNFYNDGNHGQVVENYEIILDEVGDTGLGEVGDTELGEYLKEKFESVVVKSYGSWYSSAYDQAYLGYQAKPIVRTPCKNIHNKWEFVPQGVVGADAEYNEINKARIFCYLAEANEIPELHTADIDKKIENYEKANNIIFIQEVADIIDLLKSCEKRKGKCVPRKMEPVDIELAPPSSGFTDCNMICLHDSSSVVPSEQIVRRMPLTVGAFYEVPIII